MYREVTMNEIKEVLRLWLEGIPKKRIAAQLSLDPKTVRRYVAVAETSGLAVAQGPSALTDERFTEVLLALHPTRGRPHGASWATCVAQHAALEQHLANGLRLTKIRRLLKRRGIDVPYPTLHRYAVEHLQFGRTARTVLVADGEPGHEVQLDTGWVGWLQAPTGKKRRFKAWIFTAVVCADRLPDVAAHGSTSATLDRATASALLGAPVAEAVTVAQAPGTAFTKFTVAPRGDRSAMGRE